MIITKSRYALVGYFITSYPTRAHGIIVIYLFLSRHLVAQGEISLRHHYRSSTDFSFFFYATSWHLVAHCPIPFLHHLVALSRSPRRIVKCSTQLCGQTNKTKHHCQTATDLDQSLTSHFPLKG